MNYSSRRGTIVVIVPVALKKLIMYYELTNLLQRLRTLTSLRNAMTLSRSGDCKLQALQAAYSSLFTLCQRLVSATSRSVLRRQQGEEHLELVLGMGSHPTRLSPTSSYCQITSTAAGSCTHALPQFVYIPYVKQLTN